MKQSLSIIILFLLAIKSFAAAGYSQAELDSFPLVKVITKGGKIVIGQLQYVTDSSIQILPGTNREAKKGRFYESVSLHYSDIVSFRVRTNYWLMLLFGLLGAVGLVAIIMGEIPVFNNGLGEANAFIWLSPVFIGGSIWKMLQRKGFVINGRKERFDKFRSWIHLKRNRL